MTETWGDSLENEDFSDTDSECSSIDVVLSIGTTEPSTTVDTSKHFTKTCKKFIESECTDETCTFAHFKICDYCKEKGHLKERCKKRGELTCGYCKKRGHTTKKCNKLVCKRWENVTHLGMTHEVDIGCGKRGHTFVNCPDIVCKKCEKKGHHYYKCK